MLMYLPNRVKQGKFFSSKYDCTVHDQDNITKRTHLFTKTKKENPPKQAIELGNVSEPPSNICWLPVDLIYAQGWSQQQQL